MSAETPIESAALDLRNLWALDAAGLLTPAHRCAVGVRYTCPRPDCGGEMRVRAADSERVRAHLYHVDPCRSSESTDHALAKHIVGWALAAWLRGEAPPPLFLHACVDHPVEARVLRGATAARVEAPVGSRRADVLLERGALRPVALEIVHTHPVDADKAAELAVLGVGWIELSARQVVASSRFQWRIVRSSRSRACDVCAAKETAERAEEACRARVAEVERERARICAVFDARVEAASDLAAAEIAEVELALAAATERAEAASRRAASEDARAKDAREWAARAIQTARRSTEDAERAALAATEKLRKQIRVDTAALALAYVRGLRPRHVGELIAGDRPDAGDVAAFAAWSAAAVSRERRDAEDTALGALRLEAARQLDEAAAPAPQKKGHGEAA